MHKSLSADNYKPGNPIGAVVMGRRGSRLIMVRCEVTWTQSRFEYLGAFSLRHAKGSLLVSTVVSLGAEWDFV